MALEWGRTFQHPEPWQLGIEADYTRVVYPRSSSDLRSLKESRHQNNRLHAARHSTDTKVLVQHRTAEGLALWSANQGL